MDRFAICWGALLVAALSAHPAFAQGYSTGFDDLPGWLPADAARAGCLDPGRAYGRTAYSPYVPLTGLTRPTLSFRCRVQPLPDGVSGRIARQITVSPAAPVPPILVTLACSPSEQWHRHDFPLDPAWGVVQVALESGNGAEGWLVDDFAIGDRASPLDPRLLAALSLPLLLLLLLPLSQNRRSVS